MPELTRSAVVVELIDPIEYAWEHINPGIALPERLRRSNPGPGPLQPWTHSGPPEWRPAVHTSAPRALPRQFGKGGRKSTWSEHEIEIVRSEYAIYRDARKVGELARRLNRSPPTVRQMAAVLGVSHAAFRR
ncbi:MAG: hypothetical protein ACREUT_15545 [Steroidobacteraceae bacterium]